MYFEGMNSICKLPENLRQRRPDRTKVRRRFISVTIEREWAKQGKRKTGRDFWGERSRLPVC